MVLTDDATGRYHPSVNCTFCQILEGLLPSWRVYEDENAVAFLDKGQVTRGHTLVVPRRHADDIWALSEDEAREVMRSVHRVACLLRERLGLLGLNVTQANGAAAWQEVFHYHVHVIPRYGDDGFRPPWRSTAPSQEQLSAVQRQLLHK
jgi:histidine triad (HIT) family protein